MSHIIQLALVADAFSRMVRERRKVEILFHPGWDPDAEASVRLVYYWAEALEAKSIKIFQSGEPRSLFAIEDQLSVLPMRESSLVGVESVGEVVTVVVDVSNTQFLAGASAASLKRPDFVFDHHHPGGIELFYDSPEDEDQQQVIGGQVVIPKYGCTALLLDYLLQIAIGNSAHLSEDEDLAGLVWAAFLTDQDLQRKDPKPSWLKPGVWARLEEIREMASESVVQKLAVEPWQNKDYLEMQERAFSADNLKKRTEHGISAIGCWLGNLEDSSRRPWVGHVAGVILAKKPVVADFLPDGPINVVCTTAVFPDVGERGAVSISIRTDEKIDAGELIRALTAGKGDGRRSAAAALICRENESETLEEFGQRLGIELFRYLSPCVRNAKTGD